MTILLSSIQQIPATKDRFNTIEIRTLIAEHLDVGIERVTDEAHFIEISDDDAGQIKVVGDLIRYVETWVNTGQKR